MKALYRFFTSARLAVVLILVIAALSLLATLVPQGNPEAWYRARYSSALASAIRLVGFQSFFSSALFLVPVFLFTVNLGVCAADRVIRRTKNKADRRYGPDLVHFGLLVLVAAALVTALGRQEKTWSLAAGDDAVLGSSYALRVLTVEFLKYENGTPKEWISTVRVTRDGKPEIASFPIEVNRPLRLKGISVYQAAWELQGIMELKEAGGKGVTATTGQGFRDGDSFWYFASAEQSRGAWSINAVEYRGQEMRPVSTRALLAGDTIGPFTIERVTARELTGLKVVMDPGLAPLLAALGIILAGLTLTLIQKRGDTSI